MILLKAHSIGFERELFLGKYYKSCDPISTAATIPPEWNRDEHARVYCFVYSNKFRNKVVKHYGFAWHNLETVGEQKLGHIHFERGGFG